MESFQFKTTISSLTGIKIPVGLKEKSQLNQEAQVLLIPDGESVSKNGTRMNGINYQS